MQHYANVEYMHGAVMCPSVSVRHKPAVYQNG